MPQPSLEGVLLKLRRGDEHFAALSREIATFLLDPASYDVALEHEAATRLSLVVNNARQPPADWGVLIGECVYNYHSALDQLAYQLVVANHPRGAIPASIAESSAFPIFNSGPRFRDRDRRGKPARASGLSKMRGIAPRAQAIIERSQPYHRRREPQARALWQLHELSRVDKHRLLHLTHSSVEASHFDLVGRGPIAFRGYEFFAGPLRPGVVIARWHLERTGRESTHLNVQSHLVTDIVFDRQSPARSVRGQSVMVVLAHITQFIGNRLLPLLAMELGAALDYKPPGILDTTTGETFSLR